MPCCQQTATAYVRVRVVECVMQQPRQLETAGWQLNTTCLTVLYCANAYWCGCIKCFSPAAVEGVAEVIKGAEGW